MSHPGWPWHRNFVLKFLVEVFVSLYLVNMLMDQVDTLYVDRYQSEVYAVQSWATLGDHDTESLC